MLNQNTQLRDAAVRHQIGLLRVATGYAASASQILDASEDRVRILVEEFLRTVRDENEDLMDPSVQRRLQELLLQIEDIRTRRFREIEQEMRREFTAMILAEWAWLGMTFAAVTDGAIQLVRPGGEREIARIIDSLPFGSDRIQRTLGGWLSGLAAADRDRIYAAIVSGLSNSVSTRGILVSIFGTAMARGANGVIQRTRDDIASVLRTATTAFTARAGQDMAEQNPDDIIVDRFEAVLDNRTTALCRSLDGKLYEPGEGPYPPLHMNCRSIRVSYLSRQLPERVTYEEWLRSQSEDFQDEVLGKTKGILFRRGGLSLDRFVDRAGKERTLADLARSEAKAFKAAGLDPTRWRG